jgi:tetratricopeptide (TPR) repeat protein
LTRWEEVANVEPDNPEIAYYVELLRKLLGLNKGDDKNAGDKKTKEPAEKTGFKPDSPDYFPGLNDNEIDPDANNMSRDAYVEMKLRAAVIDFSQSRYEASAKDCLFTLRADPENELAYVRLGSAYYAMGFEKYAIKAWEKALRLNPNDADLIEFMQKIKK